MSIGALAVAALALSGCGGATAAQVGSTTITPAQVDAVVDECLGGDVPEEQRSQAETQVLFQLGLAKAFDADATLTDLAPKDAEVEAALAEQLPPEILGKQACKEFYVRAEGMNQAFQRYQEQHPADAKDASAEPTVEEKLQQLVDEVDVNPMYGRVDFDPKQGVQFRSGSLSVPADKQ